MRYILASGSPRRKELLKELFPSFEIIRPVKDEVAFGSPKDKVQKLAENKAEEVFEKLKTDEDVVVIGADTVVVYQGEIFLKPKDEADAKRMLTSLSGNTHEVLTGICFIKRVQGKTVRFTGVDETEVEFFKLTEEKIDEYIKTGSPMDKAGAYGIQDGGLVKEVRGSYTNVVGLPVEKTKELYEKINKEFEI